MPPAGYEGVICVRKVSEYQRIREMSTYQGGNALNGVSQVSKGTLIPFIPQFKPIKLCLMSKRSYQGVLSAKRLL